MKNINKTHPKPPLKRGVGGILELGMPTFWLRLSKFCINYNSMWKLYTLILFGSIGITVTSIKPSFAQSNIVPDNTLGTEASQINNNLNNPDGIPSTLIEGGAERGQNLFHSLQEFSVDRGRGAYFVVPNDAIQNVLTRVTGNNPSLINGILGTISNRNFDPTNANLFLINPNGIIFGENASLNVNGSFVGTTANAISFGEQGFFSATNPQAPPLLTVNPDGLLFNQINQNAAIQNNSVASTRIRNPADSSELGFPQKVTRGDISLTNLAANQTGTISNSGNLSVNSGKNITLIGNSFENTGELKTNGGQISIAAISNEGFANLGKSGELLSLEYQPLDIIDGNASNIGTVSLKSGSLSTSDEVNGKAGNIFINATDKIFIEQASVSVNNGGITKEASDTVDGGEINIKADSLSLLGGGGINNITNGNVNAGKINIQVNSLSVKGGSINSETQGGGNNGLITIEADKLEVENGNIQSFTTSDGDARDIIINANSVSLKSGSLSTSSEVNGKAGNIFINATDNIFIEQASVSVKNGGIAQEASDTVNGGEINIKADSLSLFKAAIDNITNNNVDAGKINIQVNSLSVKGGSINSETQGGGNNGLITIEADKLEVENGNIQSFTTSDGDARDIIINANSVSLKSGSLSTSSEVNGKAGNIFINATDNIFIEQASVSVKNGGITQEASDTVNGGDINIKAKSFSLLSGSIDNRTNGNINAGKINIDANSLSVKEGSINSETQGNGKSGLVTIKTDTLNVETAQIESITKGDNNQKDIDDARGIRVNATDSVTLKNGGFSTTTEGKSNAGNIVIKAKNEILLEKAAFTTDSNGEGNAGKIILDTVSLKLDNQGIIASNANAKENDFSSKANAGEIEINADSILLQNDSAITSQTFVEGIGGEIKIQADRMILKNNSNITSSAEVNNSTGNAGKIVVDVDSILIETEPGFVNKDISNDEINPNDTSGLTSITRGKGNAGEIEVTASEIFLANKAKISTTTEYEGDAGKITLNTSLLQLENSATEDGAGIRSSSSGSGAAGEITVTTDKVLLNNSEIEALSNSGNGGNINLIVDRLLELRRGSQITTNAGTAQQGGNGGNINIDSKFIVAIPKENSDITANAFSGNGGNVVIDSQGVFGIEARDRQTSQSDITASSEQGVQGVINLNAPENNSIQNSLTELTQNLIDSEALIATSCVVRSKERNGTFYIIGSQGFPYRPGDAVPSKYSAVEVQPVPNNTSATKPRRRWKMGDPVVEPTGVYRLANGRRILSRECSK